MRCPPLRSSRDLPKSSPSAVTAESIQEHLPLVRQAVRRFLRKVPASVTADDLMAAGIRGLALGLGRGERGDEAAFGWYLRVRIRGAIVDELRQQDWLSRRERRKAREAAGDSSGKQPPALVSLEELPPGTLESVGLHGSPPDRQLDERERRQSLEQAVATLPERERLIVARHYFDGVRLKDIGAQLGVSEPRVSQLHARALGRLKSTLSAAE